MGESKQSLLKAAGLIAVVTVAAKLLGAVRDWVIFNEYGASMATDAYFAAVQIPWFCIILLGGLGGPFHTATVGVFSKLIKNGEPPDASVKQLASSFITLTSLFFIVLSVLVYFYAQPIMAVLLNGSESSLINLSAEHLKVMAPIVFLGGVIGIFYGILNVYNHFFWPSLSPAAMSLAIITAIGLTAGDETGHILAYATLIGATLQVLLQIPHFLGYKFSLLPSMNWEHPEIRKLGEVLFPMIIGTTIGQLMVYVDMLFASELGEGGWSAIILSNRLLQLPIGVLQTALLVPIFPRFSRYVADADWDGLKRDFGRGIVSLWLISVPILVMLFLYGETIIHAVFEHGEFDANDTAMVTLALVFQAFQIIPYFARDTITRVFYAFNDSVTPLIVGLIAIGIKFLLNWLLVKQFGIGGITLATTLITAINMVLLGLLSKQHLKDMGFSRMLMPLIKMLVAGIAMVAVVWFLDPLMMPLLWNLLAGIPDPVIAMTQVAVVGLMGLMVYLGFIVVLKIDDADYLIQRLGQMLKIRSS